MAAKRLPPLLLITDRKQARGPLNATIESALRGGCRFVSVREKDLDAGARAALVRELLPIARRHGALLLVHDDWDAARLCDGLHLPSGGDLQKARRVLGPSAILGISCHSVEEVRKASGADYATLGPIGETASKPGYAPVLSESGLREAIAVGEAVYALGGVGVENAGRLQEMGFAGIAVMGGVMRSEEPEQTVRELVAAFGGG